jgi:hypothetical protein
MATPLRAMQSELKRYWKNNKLLTADVHFYSRKEWEDRGEDYGQDSELSVTYEGPLNTELNYGNGRVYEATRQIAEHGYWFEMGFAWSMHFYPFQNLPADTRTPEGVSSRGEAGA